MILIDSLYINNSGGFRLLDYLTGTLQTRGIDFFLLADNRCSGLFGNCKHVCYMKATLWNRKRFYRYCDNSFSSVLCFGNIPPPLKLSIPAYTYFHNINLLTLTETHSIKQKVVSWLKREVFRHYKKNTDLWFVQTKNTANELIRHLGESVDRVKLMPFYELPKSICSLKGLNHGNDYVFVSDYTGAKGHEELLAAWGILHERGIDRTLHLTAHERNTAFIEKVNEARMRGIQIINHGFLPFEEIIELYHKSKAIIYPSHNESLGLGIVEGIAAGCDVIGSDLPFLHSICNASGVFNPYKADSIVDSIIEYEKGNSRKSELTIYNRINELIDMLVSNNRF
mgnify:CR=1 FL=1